MKIEVEWTTGPNMTGHYTGTEIIEVDDLSNLDEKIDLALRCAAKKLCWGGRLKQTGVHIIN